MVKVAKKVPGDKVSYVLRCLWHILNDPKSDKVMKWHDELKNAFVVAKEEEICEFFNTYDAFSTNFYSFRRSLYLYGFKKSRDTWTHPMLDKNDPESLKRIIRQKKLTKKKQIEHLQSLTRMFMGVRPGAYPQMYMPTNAAAFSPTMNVPGASYFQSFQEPKITKDENGRNIFIPPTTFNQLPAAIGLPTHPMETYNTLDAAYHMMNPTTPTQEFVTKVEPDQVENQN